MKMFSVHNQSFDFIGEQCAGVTWLGTDNGFALGVGKRPGPNEYEAFGCINAVDKFAAAYIPVDMRGPGLVKMASRADRVFSVMRAASSQAPYHGATLPSPVDYSGDTYPALHVGAVEAYRSEIRLPFVLAGRSWSGVDLHVGHGSFARATGKGEAHVVPHYATDVVHSNASWVTGTAPVKVKDFAVDFKVNRKKANAAGRAFKDGYAEGRALVAMFQRADAASESIRRLLESGFKEKDFIGRACPEFFNIVGLCTGAVESTGSSVEEYSVGKLGTAICRALASVGVESHGFYAADSQRLHTLDVLLYSGILTTTSGLVEACYGETK